MADLIDRQAAIDALAKFVPYVIDDASTESYTNGLTDAYNLICQLPSVQPDHTADVSKKVSISYGHENDLISRRAAIEALAKQMPESYTPDGSHPADEEIFKAQEVYADCIKTIEQLPAVQPDHVADIGKKVGWIPCSERLPVPKGHVPYLITEAHYKPEYKGRYVTIDWYDARDPECPPSWDDHGARDGVRVIAWQPLPEPYREVKNEVHHRV